MELFSDFIELVGHGVCHQIPVRSFESDGWLFPVCSRDTGTFLAFTVSFLFLFFLHRSAHPRSLPPVPYLLAFGLFVIPLAIDGLTSYAGLRETTNLIRFLTGVVMGTGLGALMYAVVGSTLMGRTYEGHLFHARRHLLLWLIGTPITAASIGHLITRMGMVGALISTFTIIFAFASIWLAVIGLTGKFERSVTTAKDLVIPAVVSVALALTILIGLAKFRDFLIGSFLSNPLL